MGADSEAEVVTAALALADALIESIKPVLDGVDVDRYAESLKHPKHADILKPLRAQAEALIKRWFRRQRASLLYHIEPGLRRMATEVREAAKEETNDDALLLLLLLRSYRKTITAMINGAQAAGASVEILAELQALADELEAPGAMAQLASELTDASTERAARLIRAFTAKSETAITAILQTPGVSAHVRAEVKALAAKVEVAAGDLVSAVAPSAPVVPGSASATQPLTASNPPPQSKTLARQRALAKAEAALPDDLLPLAVSGSMAYDYGEILQSTISGAYEQLAAELASNATINEDTMADYLRQNGLRKISGSLNQTTIDRLRNAIADAYEAGGSYSEIVSAIQREYAGFSSVRAGMIAQTELNNAYNWGRKLLGLDLGMTEKSWSCDGPDPCDVCLGNQDQGWIPIGDSFPSGDAMPTSHPMCYCSLDLRKGAD